MDIISHQHPSTGNWRCYFNGGFKVLPKTTYGNTKEEAEHKMIQFLLANHIPIKSVVFKKSKPLNANQNK